MSIQIEHRFFPVGQGLCAFGKIGFVDSGSRRDLLTNRQETKRNWFRWVYDCGSSTNKRLVSNAIDEIRSGCDSNRLDLLVLSHFHNDHISGAIELLEKVGTKVLMLPWAPLWHRLIIGFGQGFLGDDDEMLFFVDPVAYTEQIAPRRVDTFLFVLPAEGETSEYLDERLPVEPSSKWGDEASATKLELPDRKGVPIREVRSGVPLLVRHSWEFVSYNDPSTRPIHYHAFKSIVDNHREVLLSGDDVLRKSALRELRAHYNTTFARGLMNDLSLMLYGGAIQSLGGVVCFQSKNPHLFPTVRGNFNWFVETKGSILLTGDGNLSTPDRWDRAKTILTPERLSDLCLFQVPHHGARSSWHHGLAEKVAPELSIFCSDPHHNYGHPNAEVLRDFWPFYPIQVDQHSGYAFIFKEVAH